MKSHDSGRIHCSKCPFFTCTNQSELQFHVSKRHSIDTVNITPLKLPPRQFIDQTKLPGGLQSPRPMPNFTFDFAKATNESSIAYFEAPQLQYINELVSTELTKCFEKI